MINLNRGSAFQDGGDDQVIFEGLQIQAGAGILGRLKGDGA